MERALELEKLVSTARSDGSARLREKSTRLRSPIGRGGTGMVVAQVKPHQSGLLTLQ